MPAEAERPPARVLVPSVEGSLGLKLLPTVLSVIAGSADVISFLGLGGLFVSHITGNLVILAVHIVSGIAAGTALLLSVPVFIVVVGLTRLLADGLEAVGLASLRPLLLLQLLLLGGSLAICAAGLPIDPASASATVAGMLGVSAMAVQNALVQISLRGAPITAVMTTNVTRFAIDLGELVLRRDPEAAAKARRRAAQTWPAIAGFTAGAALGAAGFAAAGLLSLALPTGLALLALVMAMAARVDGGQRR